MSCSKPLSPFVCDLLYYLNRDQLERFTIVCRPLKNFIDRYFHSKPYRVFEHFRICSGSYALCHSVSVPWHQWHPNRNDYSVQQFLAGQICSTDKSKNKYVEHYSFADMRIYLGPTVRVKYTIIYVAGSSTYNPEHIVEMESIAYLWRDGDIEIYPRTKNDVRRIGAEDFQLILNSPIILQCRTLHMANAYFSFKDYKVLYTVNAIRIFLYNGKDDIDTNYLADFLKQSGVKPIVILYRFDHEVINNLLARLSKAFSSAVVPNAFEIKFLQKEEHLTEFRETNKTGEKLELKKGLPLGHQIKDVEKYLTENYFHYKLERSTI